MDIQKPNEHGWYYRPRDLDDIDVFVQDDFDDRVRRVVLSMKSYGALHPSDPRMSLVRDLEILVCAIRGSSSDAHKYLLYRTDVHGSGNGYIDPTLFATDQFAEQLKRFYAHLEQIEPFPE